MANETKDEAKKPAPQWLKTFEERAELLALESERKYSEGNRGWWLHVMMADGHSSVAFFGPDKWIFSVSCQNHGPDEMMRRARAVRDAWASITDANREAREDMERHEVEESRRDAHEADSFDRANDR